MRMMMNCHYPSQYHDDDSNDYDLNNNKKKNDGTKKTKLQHSYNDETHQSCCGYGFHNKNDKDLDEQQIMVVEQLVAIQQLELTHYTPLLSKNEKDQTLMVLSSAERDGSMHVDNNYHDELEQRCTMMDMNESPSSSPLLYNNVSCGVLSLGDCHPATNDEAYEWRMNAEPNNVDKEDERLVHFDQRRNRREQPWYGYDRTSFTSTTTTMSSTIATTTTHSFARKGPPCARGFLSTLERYWHMAVRKGLCYTNHTVTNTGTSCTVENEPRDGSTIAHYDDDAAVTTRPLDAMDVSSSSSLRSLSYSQNGNLCDHVTMMNDDDQVEVLLLDDSLRDTADQHNNVVVDGWVDHCGCDGNEDGAMMQDDSSPPPPVPLSLDDITTPDICVWRPRIAEWIYKVLDHFEVDREVAYVALWYLDRYVARCSFLHHENEIHSKREAGGRAPTVGHLEPFSLEWYQCASMACVTLASKLWAIRDPHDVLSMADLLRLSRQGSLSFGLRDVCAMELLVLHTLEWHVHPPTSCNVVSLLVRLGNTLTLPFTEDVIQLAYFLTELATLKQDYMATYDATATALAALRVSFEEHNGVGANPLSAFLMNHLTRHGIVVEMHHIRSAQAELRRLYDNHLSAAASASSGLSQDGDPSPNTTTPTPRPDTPKKRPVVVVSPKGVASGSSCTTEDNATTHPGRNASPPKVVWGRPRSLGTGTFV